MADKTDSKSVVSDHVWVQVPPPVPACGAIRGLEFLVEWQGGSPVCAESGRFLQWGRVFITTCVKFFKVPIQPHEFLYLCDLFTILRVQFNKGLRLYSQTSNFHRLYLSLF